VEPAGPSFSSMREQSNDEVAVGAVAGSSVSVVRERSNDEVTKYRTAADCCHRSIRIGDHGQQQDRIADVCLVHQDGQTHRVGDKKDASA
jgi:hypothetical protein